MMKKYFSTLTILFFLLGTISVLFSSDSEEEGETVHSSNVASAPLAVVDISDDDEAVELPAFIKKHSVLLEHLHQIRSRYLSTKGNFSTVLVERGGEVVFPAFEYSPIPFFVGTFAMDGRLLMDRFEELDGEYPHVIFNMMSNLYMADGRTVDLGRCDLYWADLSNYVATVEYNPVLKATCESEMQQQTAIFLHVLEESLKAGAKISPSAIDEAAVSVIFGDLVRLGDRLPMYGLLDDPGIVRIKNLTKVKKGIELRRGWLADPVHLRNEYVIRWHKESEKAMMYYLFNNHREIFSGTGPMVTFHIASERDPCIDCLPFLMSIVARFTGNIEIFYSRLQSFPIAAKYQGISEEYKRSIDFRDDEESTPIIYWLYFDDGGVIVKKRVMPVI